MRLPSSPEELTPEWITGAVRRFGNDWTAVSVSVLERHHGTNSNARLSITWADPGSGPATVFAKLPPADPDHRAQVLATGMGEREVRFYQDLAPTLDMTMLTPVVAEVDADTGLFVLLLEDLGDDDEALPDGVAGLTVPQVETALGDLARLHVAFADADTRATRVGWLQPRTAQSSYGRAMLITALDKHRDRLSDPFAEISRLYIDHQAEVGALWTEGPTTLLHGDPHIGNLFLRDGRVGFLDWGLITVGTPMRDVSYLITMGLDPALRQRHERALLALYVDQRNQLGAHDIDLDAAWESHRLHAAYTVVASCQIVTFPDGLSPERERFAEAFLGRSVAAIADLDAAAALRAGLAID